MFYANFSTASALSSSAHLTAFRYLIIRQGAAILT